jgi:hypothetical protein
MIAELMRSSRMTRPLLVIEDRARHFDQILEALDDLGRVASAHGGSRYDLTARTALICLDGSGGDTAISVALWLLAHPGLVVWAYDKEGDVLRLVDEVDAFAAQIGRGERSAVTALPQEVGALVRDAVDKRHYRLLKPRLHFVAEAVLKTNDGFRDYLSRLVRPGAVILSDVELETLEFAQRDPLQGVVVASQAASRGRAHLWIMSNRNIFPLDFELDTERRYSKRNVDRMAREVAERLRIRFPWRLRARASTGALIEIHDDVFVGPDDLPWLNVEFDVVLAPDGDNLHVSGRAIQPDARIVLKPGTPTLNAWEELVREQLEDGDGIAATDIDEWIQEARGTRTAAQVIAKLRDSFVKASRLKHIPEANAGTYKLGGDTTVAWLLANQG